MLDETSNIDEQKDVVIYEYMYTSHEEVHSI